MTAETLRQMRQAELDRQSGLKNRISCCTVAGCLSAGAGKVRVALQEHAGDGIEVCGTGCMGLCSQGPLVHNSATGAIYAEVKPADAPAIVDGSYQGKTLTPEDPFFAGQRRLILANSGKTDPERIADYIAQGGYQSLL